MPFARSGVEMLRNSIALSLSQVSHAGAFRDVLANQTVGVFVRSPLPGVMRCGEVECRVGRGFDLRILMELCSIISRNGFEFGGFPLK